VLLKRGLDFFKMLKNPVVHYMCKEMPVITINKVVKRIHNQKKWRAEEERHKGLLTPQKRKKEPSCVKFGTVVVHMYIVL
jgi:hypothetical protein